MSEPLPPPSTEGSDVVHFKQDSFQQVKKGKEHKYDLYLSEKNILRPKERTLWTWFDKICHGKRYDISIIANKTFEIPPTDRDTALFFIKSKVDQHNKKAKAEDEVIKLRFTSPSDKITPDQPVVVQLNETRSTPKLFADKVVSAVVKEREDRALAVQKKLLEKAIAEIGGPRLQPSYIHIMATFTPKEGFENVSFIFNEPKMLQVLPNLIKEGGALHKQGALFFQEAKRQGFFDFTWLTAKLREGMSDRGMREGMSDRGMKSDPLTEIANVFNAAVVINREAIKKTLTECITRLTQYGLSRFLKIPFSAENLTLLTEVITELDSEKKSDVEKMIKNLYPKEDPKSNIRMLAAELRISGKV